MKSILFFSLLLLKLIYCNGQQFKTAVGAPYLGLSAYTTHGLTVLGATSNQASLAGLKHAGVGLYAEQRFGLSEVKNFAMSIAVPTRSGTIGVQLNRYGGTSYNENQVGIAYAKALSSKVSVGGKVNYYNQTISGLYGSASTVNFEAALLIHLTSKLTSGISVYNPVASKYGINKEEKLNSIYKFGLGYDVSDKVAITAEATKEENEKVNIISAVEYQFINQFFAKVGFASAANTLYAAAGVTLWNKLRIDCSVSHHQQLGFSPGIIVHYNFNTK